MGTGRFAAALGVTKWIGAFDSMRELAQQRGVATANAAGDRLPYADGIFDLVWDEVGRQSAR